MNQLTDKVTGDARRLLAWKGVEATVFIAFPPTAAGTNK